MHIGLTSTKALQARWCKLHHKIEVQRRGYTATEVGEFIYLQEELVKRLTE